MAAPSGLLRIDPEGATELLRALAQETALRASDRLAAARNLVLLNAPDGLATLRVLRRDDTLGRIRRGQATLMPLRNARSSD